MYNNVFLWGTLPGTILLGLLKDPLGEVVGILDGALGEPPAKTVD